MAEETKTNPRAAAQLSGRVTQATLDKFREIQESESFETFGQFIESLLMHYYDPVKVNKDNEVEINHLKQTVADLQQKVKDCNADNKAACDLVNEERAKYADLKAKYEELSKANMQQAGRLEELDGIQHKMDGHILVPVNELDMRCLEWLASRENKQRKREDITPAVFFQYAVREMLIKGNKFAIDSVPDSVIDKFKKEIAHGQ